MTAADPVLHALAGALGVTTGASAGWILLAGDDRLTVAALLGLASDVAAVDDEVDASGAPALVAASAQPIAVSPRAGDAILGGGLAARVLPNPSGVLCVPCVADDTVVGVVELVRQDGVAFTFDDVEIASVLADVGAVAMATRGPRLAVPAPGVIAQELAHLESHAPARYAALAQLVRELRAP